MAGKENIENDEIEGTLQQLHPIGLQCAKVPSESSLAVTNDLSIPVVFLCVLLRQEACR